MTVFCALAGAKTAIARLFGSCAKRGRYLPEYQPPHAPKRATIMGLATNVDFAHLKSEALQPLSAYPLMPLSCSGDILTVPDAVGLGLSF
jgi:uroporphyrinogen-III decarboxylase